ncbi:MAG: precorrin-6y C5,15-methyltransferase (decarboxylating) subunit CbiE [Bacteroidia bacterium]|nr:MAG: precorrin-6y C5,15-methyltransferase (decarboxylating) subunit CbiE [Bacteroidia bacterium]
MNKSMITICGIGPGNPNLISKAVYQQVEKADLLIGGRRHLAIFQASEKATCLFDGKLQKLKETLANNLDKNIVVLVSGDTGFYSLRRFIKKTFPDLPIKLIPGISSYQYFYARVGLGYEHALLSSMHGKELDYISKVDSYDSVFILTDRKNNWKSIAQDLVDADMGHLKMFVGNNLSYPDEQIVELTAQELITKEFDFPLCSIILICKPDNIC